MFSSDQAALGTRPADLACRPGRKAFRDAKQCVPPGEGGTRLSRWTAHSADSATCTGLERGLKSQRLMAFLIRMVWRSNSR